MAERVPAHETDEVRQHRVRIQCATYPAATLTDRTPPSPHPPPSPGADPDADAARGVGRCRPRNLPVPVPAEMEGLPSTLRACLPWWCPAAATTAGEDEEARWRAADQHGLAAPLTAHDT